MTDAFLALFNQSPMALIVTGLWSLGVSYVVTQQLMSWLYGAMIFPGLVIGGLLGIELGQMLALLPARDSDITLIVACALGIATSFFIQVGIFTLFNWMTSYNRRDLEAVLERQQRLKRHI